MTPQDINTHLWHVVNYLGWIWWSIPIALSVHILVQVYRLDELHSRAGRYGRVALVLGAILMLMAPFFNVAGALAFPLFLFALAIMVTERAGEAALKRRYEPRVAGIVSNVAKAAVAPRR